jgi:segregation and condensation protein B
MEYNEIECKLEAVLFASGESISEDKLCAVLGVDKVTLTETAQNLADYYDYNRRGIKLIKLDNRYQLCSRAEYGREVRNALETRRRPTLTPSALEVLAIIAYKQPVTKAEIEKIRGVKSDHAVNKLIEYELVMELGRLDAPGRPILFGTTEEFLRSFGVENIGELPDLDPVKIADFKAEAEEEASLQITT